MRWFVIVVFSVAAVASHAVPVLAQSPESAPPKRTLTVSKSVVEIGDKINVEGTGWPAGRVVSVTVCGNLALRGSLDCAQTTNVPTLSSSSGEIAAQIIVGAPPADCPCVVHATAVGAAGRVDTPIDIEGHPVSDLVRPQEPAQPELEVEVIAIEGAGPWSSWLGASAARSVTVELANAGSVAVEEGQGLLKVGRSANPSTVAAAFDVPPLEPGEVQTLTIDVAMPAPNFGEYWVAATVDTFPARFTGAESTSTWPWGLLLLIALALQWPIWRGRNWVRDRFAEVSEASALTAVVPAALPEKSTIEAAPAVASASAAGLAIAATPSGAPPETVSVAPVPIVMGVANPNNAHVPVHFEAVPAGQAPVVTVEFDNDSDDGIARLRSITIGGDIELRMRPVAHEAFPASGSSEEVG